MLHRDTAIERKMRLGNRFINKKAKSNIAIKKILQLI